MQTKFKKHIAQKFPVLTQQKILLACSGGVDSMVLAQLLLDSKYNFAIAHCNFKLRDAESDEDEHFVINWAKIHSVEVFTVAFQTKEYAKSKGISTQMAARELRYAWFYELAEKYQLDYIATAHHLDDDLETFLINLSRGSGIKGLLGIPAVNNKIIRPLLPFTQEEILQFAHQKGITWREDSSNQTNDYLRNTLRHNVIPQFKEVTPQLTRHFLKTKQHLVQTNHLVEDYISLIQHWVVEEKDKEIYLDIEKLTKLPHTQALLYELLAPFGFTNWEDVNHLLEAQSGKFVLSEKFRLLKDRGVLIISERKKETEEKQFLISEEINEISHPFSMRLEKVSTLNKTEPNTVFIDNSLLKYPLILRKWQEGDYFYPFGMKGKKKISKFFKDEKLSLAEKEKAWVLSSENKIVWIVGYRLDNRFKVTDKTHQIVKIAVK